MPFDIRNRFVSLIKMYGIDGSFRSIIRQRVRKARNVSLNFRKIGFGKFSTVALSVKYEVSA